MIEEQFQSGKKFYSCSITMPDEEVEFVVANCDKCKTLCNHVLDLAIKNDKNPLSSIFMNSLWFSDLVNYSTVQKALKVLPMITVQKNDGELESIVQGNQETYSVLVTPQKLFCSCIFGRTNGICYHKVAVLFKGIFTKALSLQAVKEVLNGRSI